jgi:hypothetical protein
MGCIAPERVAMTVVRRRFGRPIPVCACGRPYGRSQPSRFDYDVCVILLRQEGIKNFEQGQFNVLVGTQEAPMRR